MMCCVGLFNTQTSERNRGVFLHRKIDFTNIASVSLVDKSDVEYRKWLNTLISVQKKENPNSTKRLFIIEKYPDLFQYIKNLWNSGVYEVAESKKYYLLCVNCKRCSIDKYRVGSFVCWKNYISGKPNNIVPTSSCNGFELKAFPDKIAFVWQDVKTRFGLRTSNFDKMGIYPGNFRFFLKDMGLIDSVKLGWTVGKENERDFFERIKQIDSSIQFLPTVFKIRYNNGNGLKFNILDGFIRLPLGELCIIEFKSASYYQDETQDKDYLLLFDMSKYPISEHGCYYLSVYKEREYDNNLETKELHSIPYINKISDKVFFNIIKYQTDTTFSGIMKEKSLFEI